MACKLQIHEKLTSPPIRNINNVKLCFSLTNNLKISINGKSFKMDNHISIINNGDIYYIESGENIVELTIPIFYFYIKDANVFNYYFDRHLLQSNLYLKSLIFNAIDKYQNDSQIDENIISKVIQLLYKEAVIKYPDFYTSMISVEHPTFSKALGFINHHIQESLTLLDVSTHCNISESYCSNLFTRYLKMNFKEYFVGLKVIRALYLLLSSKESISSIAHSTGFTSHTNFTNQFKKFLNFSPKEFRSKLNTSNGTPIISLPNNITLDNLNLIQQYEIIDQLATERTHINIDQFNPQDHTKSSQAFIRFRSVSELFQFIFNEDYHIDLSYLPNPAVLINDITDVMNQELNINLLNLCFEKLFENQISLAITIKNMEQFQAVYHVILTFLENNQDYKRNIKSAKFMIVFDSRSMPINQIHLSHLKIKNKNKNIKFGLIVDGLIETCHTIQETYDIMNRMQFHYYFVDIENIDTKRCLIDKATGFTYAATHFENYLQFIKNSNIPSTQFVYSNLTKRCFKYTNNGTHPLQLSDLVCHLTQLMKYGGVCYQLLEEDPLDIALFNQYGSVKPLMHLYQFCAPFVREPILITNNYIMSRKDEDYHFLLFNKINNRYLSDNQQHFSFTNQLNESSLHIIHTLNKDHGVIDNIIPHKKAPLYIEKSILKQLEQTNHPKVELFVQESKHQKVEVTLNYDEVKYVCLKAR